MTVLMPLIFFILPPRDYSPTERRYLADTPGLSWESLLNGELSEKVEEYLSDHLPGRNFFVGVNAYFNLFTGRGSAGSVYYGKDGYLIRSPEDCTTEQFVKNLSRFDEFAHASGLPASLIMIPTAGDVLEDKLPLNHAPYRYKECLELAKNLCGAIKPVELFDTLRSAGETNQIYYKTDHHLTSAGCYAVYSKMCEMKGQDALKPEDYSVSTYDGFHGTTWSSSGYWLAGPDTMEIWDSGAKLNVTISEAGKDDITAGSAFFTQNLASDDPYTVFLDGNHALVRIEDPSANGGTLLALRDSYAHCLAPFLAGDYKSIILVDMRYYRESVAKLIEGYNVTELAFIYGLDSLLTDTNSAWLD